MILNIPLTNGVKKYIFLEKHITYYINENDIVDNQDEHTLIRLRGYDWISSLMIPSNKIHTEEFIEI